ncbi:MAG: hypothetical protein HY783_06180 [Chloroflexi bacterium]|nr:hypothetical protein [Chloroflexota bacterium]
MNKSSAALPTLHPRWVVAGVIVAATLIWGASLYSITSQIGRPFPGFFYAPDRIVSAFTPQDFTGWQADLRPWDRIVEVMKLPVSVCHQVSIIGHHECS